MTRTRRSPEEIIRVLALKQLARAEKKLQDLNGEVEAAQTEYVKWEGILASLGAFPPDVGENKPERTEPPPPLPMGMPDVDAILADKEPTQAITEELMALYGRGTTQKEIDASLRAKGFSVTAYRWGAMVGLLQRGEPFRVLHKEGERPPT